ncbi:hypothetical protein VIGAN_03265900 [Vigna angularis var. angularis]|uniref:CLAVATA3/ESR-like protein n=2 Tax=Phaseolus angularis TaxID=3914 RepID=A0A0S3RPW4_PHAAN|nr:hypothetical protein VIGAN_03265900 [Vigna angularis var. angularis]
MLFHHCSLLGGFKSFMVFLLLALQVSAQNQHPSLLVDHRFHHSHTMPQNQQNLDQHHRPRYPFGVYFPQKRKVPNASDPLHNR